jgi:hypothetical protein
VATGRLLRVASRPSDAPDRGRVILEQERVAGPNIALGRSLVHGKEGAGNRAGPAPLYQVDFLRAIAFWSNRLQRFCLFNVVPHRLAVIPANISDPSISCSVVNDDQVGLKCAGLLK